MEELTAVASSRKKGKAPGPDRIPSEAILVAIEEHGEWILGMLNDLLARQEFPAEWKIASVVLIKKKSNTPDVPGSYRPICLLNVLSKIFEALIRSRLDTVIGEQNLYSERQYGFRKGRSTIQAMNMVREAPRSPNAKWRVLITLDIRNAFNSANWSLILEKLASAEVPIYLRNIIAEYLKGRKICVTDGRRSFSMSINAGVPQGSVLGPTLWNLLYDDVLRVELEGDTTCIGFADDLAMVSTANNSEDLMYNVNVSLRRIGYWLKDHRLQLAPEKIEAVLLKGKRRRDHVNFRIQDVTIVPKKSLKYLGVTFGSNGSFAEHIRKAAAKAEERAGKLARLMPRIGGATTSKRRLLLSTVHSIVLYGAPIWSHFLQYAKYGNILESSQRKALIGVTAAYRTVSTVALQVIAGVIPIKILAEEKCYIFEQGGGSEVKARARSLSLEKWQEEWDKNSSTGQWTKRLIPNVTEWYMCKHRTLNYYTTQALTAHGSFRSFTKRIQKETEDSCPYCGAVDTAEHTLFVCERWVAARSRLESKIGHVITPDNLASVMLGSKELWREVQQMLLEIMKEKEEDERRRQAAERETDATLL